jgi:hypothetical protein
MNVCCVSYTCVAHLFTSSIAVCAYITTLGTRRSCKIWHESKRSSRSARQRTRRRPSQRLVKTKLRKRERCWRQRKKPRRARPNNRRWRVGLELLLLARFTMTRTTQSLVFTQVLTCSQNPRPVPVPTVQSAVDLTSGHLPHQLDRAMVFRQRLPRRLRLLATPLRPNRQMAGLEELPQIHLRRQDLQDLRGQPIPLGHQ